MPADTLADACFLSQVFFQKQPVAQALGAMISITLCWVCHIKYQPYVEERHACLHPPTHPPCMHSHATARTDYLDNINLFMLTVIATSAMAFVIWHISYGILVMA